MLNVHELESRWLRYKIKSYAPYFIIFVSLCIIAVSVALWPFQKGSQTQDNEQKIMQTTKKSNEPAQESNVHKVQKHFMQTPPATTQTKQNIEQKYKVQDTIIKNERSTRVLTPSMDFIKEIEPSKKTSMQSPQDSIEEIILEPTLEQESVTPKEKEQKKEVLQERPAKQEESLKISIHRKSQYEDIAGVVKRFKKNNNPALSLFIAKKYYELQDYKNAYNYALITNEINRDIESSWIVFAKSLVKLGKKEMAVQTLREYVKESGSDSARILLDEITSGKFR